MPKHLEVLFTPAEFAALSCRDLSKTVCVVLDVLRATSSMATALANDATAVFPADSIPEALELARTHPGALLAGERDGVRIRSELTGSIDFSLGNSPREFTREKVGGQSLIMTTTNGTRALRACTNSREVLIASFLHLKATAEHICRQEPAELLVICSGTYEEAAYEDVLGAGALCDLIWTDYQGGAVADSAHMARKLYLAEQPDLFGALARSRNGKRLLSRPELHDDVEFCSRRDVFDLVARLESDGAIRRLHNGGPRGARTRQGP